METHHVVTGFNMVRSVQRWQVEQWATGFLSGASYAMDHPIRDTDFNSIKAFIDQYCAKNPLNRVIRSGRKLNIAA